MVERLRLDKALLHKAPAQVPGAKQRSVAPRAQMMPGQDGATLSPFGGAMQQRQSGANPATLGPQPSPTYDPSGRIVGPAWNGAGGPGNTASNVPNNPQLQGSRAAAAIPLPPGQAPSRYNEVAGPNPPTYISDVDLSQNIWSPFQPVVPFGPPYVNYPRTFDYAVGLNLDFTSEGRLTFCKMLQALSRTWGILRSVLETRKDQLMRIPWDFRLVDKPKDKDHPRLQELRDFFKKPDGDHTFNQWMRMQLEDKFVIDAANYYVWKDRGGKPLALMQVSGELIKPLIDDAGRRPVYPNPSYQQLIKGLPWQNLDSHEFLYAPQRPTAQNPLYGYSEVQMIYIEILQGIKKMLYKLSYWDEGSIPNLMITVPSGWTPEQLAMFQAHFDVMLAGNIPFKSRVKFMPSDSKPFDLKNANGELLKTEEDEWVTRLVCYTFSVPPTPFIRQLNRSTAETAQAEAEEEGLHPLMQWVQESLINPVVQSKELGFGYDDIEFVWLPEPETDQQKQMTTLTGYVKVAAMTIDELREQINLPPLPNGAGAEALVITPQGPAPLAETTEAARQRALAVPDQIEQQKNNTQEMHDARVQQVKNPPPPMQFGGGQPGQQPPPQNGKGNGQDNKVPSGHGPTPSSQDQLQSRQLSKPNPKQTPKAGKGNSKPAAQAKAKPEVGKFSHAPFRKSQSQAYAWDALAAFAAHAHGTAGGGTDNG